MSEPCKARFVLVYRFFRRWESFLEGGFAFGLAVAHTLEALKIFGGM